MALCVILFLCCTYIVNLSIKKYCIEANISKENISEDLIKEEDFTKTIDDVGKTGESKTDGKIEKIIETGDSSYENIQFFYDSKTKMCFISNKNLSDFLDFYAKRRKEKSGFKNPIWYLILKQYLYEFLPNVSSKFWDLVGESVRIRALQCLGNNLRMTKEPFPSSSSSFSCDDFKEGGYTCLAEDINLAIKVLRAYKRAYKLVVCPVDGTQFYNPTTKINDTANPYTIVVIDSIKNPYESMYLKQRYTNYYLIGIYTEDEHRKSRLRKREHLTDEEIDIIDIIENNSGLKKRLLKYEETKETKETKNNFIRNIYDQISSCDLLETIPYISPFIFQNVPGCLESADILINNKTDNQSYIYLKKILLRYICLIMNPAIVLPTKIERCMQIAYTAKLNSGCISRQVGAALTDYEYHLLSIGWNQQPEGQLPCTYRDLCELHHHWSSDSYSDYENDDNSLFQKK